MPSGALLSLGWEPLFWGSWNNTPAHDYVKQNSMPWERGGDGHMSSFAIVGRTASQIDNLKQPEDLNLANQDLFIFSLFPFLGVNWLACLLCISTFKTQLQCTWMFMPYTSFPDKALAFQTRRVHAMGTNKCFSTLLLQHLIYLFAGELMDSKISEQLILLPDQHLDKSDENWKCVAVPSFLLFPGLKHKLWEPRSESTGSSH